MGTHTRTVLDVGCGVSNIGGCVSNIGGYLPDRLGGTRLASPVTKFR
jgi:hypothetical protein